MATRKQVIIEEITRGVRYSIRRNEGAKWDAVIRDQVQESADLSRPVRELLRAGKLALDGKPGDLSRRIVLG